MQDRRCGSDLAWLWLWLWHRTAVGTSIWPLAWQLPYAKDAALKKKQKNKKKKQNPQQFHCIKKNKILRNKFNKRGTRFSSEIDILILKVTQKYKALRIAKTILKQKNKVGELTTSASQLQNFLQSYSSQDWVVLA